MYFQNIPTFLPIMRGALNIPMMRDPEVLDKLDYTVIFRMLNAYQQHLRTCAKTVSTEQNALSRRIQEVSSFKRNLIFILNSFQMLWIHEICLYLFIAIIYNHIWNGLVALLKYWNHIFDHWIVNHFSLGFKVTVATFCNDLFLQSQTVCVVALE